MKLSKRSNKLRNNSKRNKNLKKGVTLQKYRYTSRNIGGATKTPMFLDNKIIGHHTSFQPVNIFEPTCPWQLDIVRTVLLGISDEQSQLCQLQGKGDILENIIKNWAWPDVLVNSARLWETEKLLNVLIGEMLEVNPHRQVTEAKLRQKLQLNPDGSIKNWYLYPLLNVGIVTVHYSYSLPCAWRRDRGSMAPHLYKSE